MGAGAPVLREGLTPATVEQALESTALDMQQRVGPNDLEVFASPAGFDADSGAGFVDADAAIRSVARP